MVFFNYAKILNIQLFFQSTSSPGVSFHTGFPYIDASPIEAGHAVLMLMQRPQSNPTAITTVVLQTPIDDLPNLLESIRHHLSLSGSEPSGIVHRPIEAPPSPIIEDTVEPIIATMSSLELSDTRIDSTTSALSRTFTGVDPTWTKHPEAGRK